MGLCFPLFHKLYENLEASAFYFSEIIYVSQYITPCTFTRSIEEGGGGGDVQIYKVIGFGELAQKDQFTGLWPSPLPRLRR